jgi:hypothetical protein
VCVCVCVCACVCVCVFNTQQKHCLKVAKCLHEQCNFNHLGAFITGNKSFFVFVSLFFLIVIAIVLLFFL